MAKVIHMDSGKFYLYPFSGRHTVCLCGKSFQDSYTADAVRHTKEKKKVTCKKCLRKMEK